MGIFDQLKMAGAKQMLAYIEKDPDTNILKIIDWMIRFDVAGAKHNGDLVTVRSCLADQDSNWYKLVKSLWTDIDDGIRKTIFENLVINVGLSRDETARAVGGELPMALMLDQEKGVSPSHLRPPVSRNVDEYDAAISKNKNRGIYAYVMTGGISSLRADALGKLARLHGDCVFVFMMQAGEVTESFADMVLASKNIVPMVAHEGSEAAMDTLRRKKILFGLTAGCTDANVEEIISETFVDKATMMGAKLVWLFGEDADGSSLSGENSARIYERVLSCRNTKALLEVDFMHEERFIGGRVEGI